MNKSVELKNKLLIIGSPGSGKSHLARKLAERYSYPVMHLDAVYWQEGWVGLPRPEFLERVLEFMTADRYIVDGNYTSTLRDRLQHAEQVIYLDYPAWVCLRGERKRRGTKRPDLPDFLEEKRDKEFLSYIRTFRRKQRPKLLSILAEYPAIDVVILHSRRETRKFFISK